MIVIGILLAPLVIAVIAKAEQPNHHAKSATISPTTKPVLSVTTPKTASVNQALDPEQLLPEDGNMSNFLANKFLETVPPPSSDCQVVACVALTFDDGPNPDSTPIILNALEHHFVNASFFEIGKKVAGNETILRRMQRDGDDIGNHSWSHQSFLTLTPAQMKQQINQTQQAIANAGVKPPHLFRPPYGDFKLEMQKTIKLPVILWNVDPKDWAQTSPDKIAEIVAQQIKPGAIIVMHDKPNTAAAVDKIITALKSKYHFVTVTELLNLQPDSKGAYIGR